jgi:hypothetical protein
MKDHCVGTPLCGSELILLLVFWRGGRFLSVAFTDFLDSRFVVAVDLSCLLSLVRKFVYFYGCLVVGAKLVGEQDAESSDGG